MRLLLAALAVTGALAGQATAAGKPHVLHVGNTGKRVAALEWLLAGHRPSVYKIQAWRKPIDRRYTTELAQAVRNMKWRLGYPDQRDCAGHKLGHSKISGTAGQLLFDLLKGKRARPACWIALASKRLRPHPIKPTSCAVNLIRTARKEIGVHEIPDGSNNGPRVHFYEESTGAYGEPWCASFAQKMLQLVGVGSIADRSAGVFHIIDWSRQRGYLNAQPRTGALVGFLHALGHMGIVEKIGTNGFWSIEGNHANAVQRVYHPFGDKLTVFVWLPACTT